MSTEIDTIVDTHTQSTPPDIKGLKAALAEYVKAQKSEDGKFKNAMASFFTGQSKAAQDPVALMKEVMRDDTYDENEKLILFAMSRERFKNRRRMAYISLFVLVGAAVLLGLAVVLDGFYAIECTATNVPVDGCTAGTPHYRFSEVIKNNSEAISWLGSFFTGVIALYFGAASLRPTS